MFDEKLLKKIQENYNHIMQTVGASPKKHLFGPAKLFLALTENAATKERNLIALSICCFCQALDEHCSGKYTVNELITGDYCYAQGIHIAGLSGNPEIVRVLSRTIADITSGCKDGFTSMEEIAAYLAGYILNKKALENYRSLGKSVKEKDEKSIGESLSLLGLNKNLVSVIAG